MTSYNMFSFNASKEKFHENIQNRKIDEVLGLQLFVSATALEK